MRSIRLGPAFLILTALLVAGAAAADPQHSQGAIKERLVLDNDSVRVTFLTFPSGAATGLHLNTEPEIGIVVEGEITLITRRGKEVLKSGSVVWLDPISAHDARNAGKRPAKLWALSLKKCE